LFGKETEVDVQLPINATTVNKFIEWAHQKKKLTAKTITAYLTAIANKHLILGLDSSEIFNPIGKIMLKGANNLESNSNSNKSNKNIFSLPLLKILGNNIAKSDWHPFSKQTIWVVALLAFFGSCRIGELLPISWKNFDVKSNLTWKDVIVKEDCIQIHVKSPKTKTKGGEFIDIFEFKGQGCCPVASFKKFKEMAAVEGLIENNMPVFRLLKGKLLTKNSFNKTINDLLCETTKLIGAKITGHSFRAAIPSMLAKFPELANEGHIMGWGRWSSKAYLNYTRLHHSQKKFIFTKIVQVLKK